MIGMVGALTVTYKTGLTMPIRMCTDSIPSRGLSRDSSSGRGVPMKEIPGSYGLPFFGAIKDRLDFNIFQQMPGFYTSRRDKYQSTVYRTNVAPGPPFFPDPRVIVLIDEKSYLVLYDMDKVSKKDTFFGTYVPSLKLTGGYRVLPLLDPSEPKHAVLKTFAFEILKRSGPQMVPELAASIDGVISSWESSIKKHGKVSYTSELDQGTFQSMVKSFTGRDPYKSGEHSIGKFGSIDSLLWVFAQIAPITVIPQVPWFLAPIAELLVHTFPIPPFLVKLPYGKLVKFFSAYGTDLLEYAEKELGLDKEEALHNYIYISIFNAWAGVKLFFPTIIQRLGATTAEYQRELSAEVKGALDSNDGKLDCQSLAAMPLVESAVFEVLRMEPPVPYQYAKAKQDLVVESHDAAFLVKKGETLAGYAPVACRDPKIFDDAETFVPKRFVGDEGRALLKYVLWSNGRQTDQPELSNKQCPAADFVPVLAKAFVATIYSTYETIQVDPRDKSYLTVLKRGAGNAAGQ